MLSYTSRYSPGVHVVGVQGHGFLNWHSHGPAGQPATAAPAEAHLANSCVYPRRVVHFRDVRIPEFWVRVPSAVLRPHPPAK